MSFFDDASLAFLPSGAAGKDGKAYSIKPVPVYGNEILTQPVDISIDFTANSGGVIVDANTFTTAGGLSDGIISSSLIQAGKTYRLEIQGTTTSSGFTFGNGGTGSGNEYGAGFGVHYFTAAHQTLWFRQGTAGTTDITTFSIKEVSNIGDFDFSRGSNLAATRVGPTGLIEKGRENLILQSNQFDTTWLTTNASVTSGQSGYDGSSDAWSLTSTALNGSHRIIQTFTGGSNSIVTYSLFAKSNGYNFLRIVENASTGDFATFNLSNGSVANNTAIANAATISSVGNGWYRCSISVDGGNNTRFDIYTMETSGATDFLGDGVSGAYIQDAQAEIGLAASEPIESGASTGKAGLLEDEPRFDYSGGATCPSLLLEPSRTQLVKFSEYFGSGWSLQNISPTYNHSISPEGLQNATLINDGTAASTQHWFFQSIPFSSGNTYTISFYAKYVDRKNMFINIYDGATSNFVFYDIQNGVVLNNDGNAVRDIVDVGNGWYRIIYTRAVVGSGANFRIGMANDTPVFTYTGENKQALVYGFQVEQGSYPTSYIPNHSGGTITRGGDNCFTNNNSLLEQTSATYFLEVTPIEIVSNNLIEVRGNGSSNNRIILQTTVGGDIRVLVRTQGSSILDQNVNSAVSRNTKVKVALKYTPSNISFFVDGVKKIDTDVSVDFSPELNGLDLEGSETANDDALKQHQFLFFPEALSDADCITLTTI